jgi:hypothetical protein
MMCVLKELSSLSRSCHIPPTSTGDGLPSIPLTIPAAPSKGITVHEMPAAASIRLLISPGHNSPTATIS